MKRALILAAVAALTVTPAAAAGKNPISVGAALLNDVKAAENMSGPASAPVDPTGYACYSLGVKQLGSFGSQTPDGIISTGEAIWLLFQAQRVLALDSNCQSVCGRAQLLAGKVGGLIGALAMPNVCGAFTSLAE